jgi:hypothetical protein
MFVREISAYPFSAMVEVTISGQLAVVGTTTILRYGLKINRSFG